MGIVPFTQHAPAIADVRRWAQLASERLKTTCAVSHDEACRVWAHPKDYHRA